MKKIGDIIGRNLSEIQISALEERLKQVLDLNTVKIEKKYPHAKDDDTYSYFTEDECILDIIFDKYSDDIKIAKINYLDEDGNRDQYGAIRTFNEFFTSKSK